MFSCRIFHNKNSWTKASGHTCSMCSVEQLKRIIVKSKMKELIFWPATFWKIRSFVFDFLTLTLPNRYLPSTSDRMFLHEALPLVKTNRFYLSERFLHTNKFTVCWTCKARCAEYELWSSPPQVLKLAIIKISMIKCELEYRRQHGKEQ